MLKLFERCFVNEAGVDKGGARNFFAWGQICEGGLGAASSKFFPDSTS